MRIIALLMCCLAAAGCEMNPCTECNPDAPVGPCTVKVGWDSAGTVISAQDKTGQNNVHAVVSWITGISTNDPNSPDSAVQDLQHHGTLVTPQGTPIYFAPNVASSLERDGCLQIETFAPKALRPKKVRDAKKPLSITCPNTAQTSSLPQQTFTDIGTIVIDPRNGVMHIFGVRTTLLSYDGTGYVGTARAVSGRINKTTGDYTLWPEDLPPIHGTCTPPHAAIR